MIGMLFVFIFAKSASSIFIHVYIHVVINLLWYFWIKFNLKMPKFLTIQKHDIRRFSLSSFAATLKPNDFDGTNYKRWRAKIVLWLTAMNCYHVARGKPEQLAAEDEQKFTATDNLFRGAIISVLHSKYEDNYIICATGKELWDALDAQFGVSDAGSQLCFLQSRGAPFSGGNDMKCRPASAGAHVLAGVGGVLRHGSSG
jgi:hypothetical protein